MVARLPALPLLLLSAVLNAQLALVISTAETVTASVPSSPSSYSSSQSQLKYEHEYSSYFSPPLMKSRNNDTGGASEATYLATERTYLASVRTALALLGFGLVLSKIFVGSTISSRLSPGIAGSSVFGCTAYLLASTVRYFRVIALLQKDDFEVDKVGPAIIFVFCFSLVLVAGFVIHEFRVAGKKEKETTATDGANENDVPLLQRDGDPTGLSDPLSSSSNSIYEDNVSSAQQQQQAIMAQQQQLLQKLDTLLSLMQKDLTSRGVQ